MPTTAPPSKPLSAGQRSALIAAALVILTITGVLLYALASGPRGAGPEQEPGALPAARSNSHVLDDAGPDAPTLVEFMDFECEACGAFYPVVEDLRARYDGQIDYVIRYFPIASHANSMNAAVAVEAAAQQGQLEQMYQRMFETQTTWGEQQQSQADLFRTFAEDLGLDMAAFDAAVADPATEARVQQDLDDGRALGVQGTPTFYLDGEQLELSSFSDLTDAIDRALSGAGT